MSRYPSRVTVTDVGPRDGLQNEAVALSTDDKLRLIEALLDAGVSHIEATSFVHPKWIPQLEDADRLFPRLPRRPGVVYSALVPNERGYERARAVGCDRIVVFLSASDSHNKANVNRTTEQSLEALEPLVRRAKADGVHVEAAVSTSFGCPFEGRVPADRVLGVASRLAAAGVDAVGLADTVGHGNPAQVRDLFERAREVLPADVELVAHFHDTRGLGLANALAALEAGVTHFDASIAGLGGCPYAPGATGNIATEELVYMLGEMGIETGIDLPALLTAADLADRLLGRQAQGRLRRALRAARSVPHATAS
ncbi:MAG TPA: hydroxymethylglutaryl-CoA lyase [Thermodesulfobacteriota bacterium]